jgi:predicted lipid-binding transport protein (Tim44 family)
MKRKTATAVQAPRQKANRMSNLHRFLGGSPAGVLVKLLFLSLLVGAFMAFLDITPFGLIDQVVEWIRSIFDLSFETVREVGRWVIYGAIIVIPIWLLSRLFNARR